MIDLHTHTLISVDGKSSMDDYCKHILQNGNGGGELGPDIICFTDHYDNNEADNGYLIYNAANFFDEYYSIKDKYAEQEANGRLLILAGVEFGEPHLYPRELEKCYRLPYDMIIGSVHFFWGNTFISDMIRMNYPVKEAFKRYYEEVYKTVSVGGFDVLAHMDFPKRYFGEEYYEPDVIESIFAQMRKNNIIPEINTSSLRQGLPEAMPGNGILSIYEQTGGKCVTIGADAHRAEHYALFNDEAFALCKGRFEIKVFIERKPRNAELFRSSNPSKPSEPI